MADEDATTTNPETTDDESPRTQSRRTAPKSKPKNRQPKPKCRSRIDQLAIPSRRLILGLYQDHAHHLPREKVEKIKILLQELYAMTPEETEKYFAHLRKKAEDVSRRKDIKYMLKKLLKRKNKTKQRQKAYKTVNELLIKGLEFALKNPIPPVVSVRLRNLSNIILEQMCDLQNVNLPSRDDPDPAGSVLIAVADWMAIAVEHLYYHVQLTKNKEMEQIEKEAKAREKERKVEPKKEEKVEEVGGEVTEDYEAGDEEAVLSEPLLVSEVE